MRTIDGQDGAIVEAKIAALPDVREWVEEMPVELWVNRAGRLVLRAYNEDGHNSTEIDMFDLISWLESESGFGQTAAFTALPAS